ncbi:hypothetical protein EHO59_17785 [Leptospira semungkisensis]|uniref:Uncharacterized protein n=1 Tax=Leptospira semungkisensis TaxID=2484985 RepID=A0A4R9FN53_9LEPT|nr:hypothetical protein [Leptospira semungkisensis]TGJ99684.1 hypothetical protein EHO59_17785 [Leptospira semungkisensis]
MKAKICIFLIIVIGQASCVTSGFFGKEYNENREISYGVQEARLLQANNPDLALRSTSEVVLRAYGDLFFFVPNVIYYVFARQTFFGTLGNGTDDVDLNRADSAALERYTALQRGEGEDRSRNTNAAAQVATNWGLNTVFDLILYVPNLVYFPIADKTIFGTFEVVGIDVRDKYYSARKVRARDLLRLSAIRRSPQTVQVSFLGVRSDVEVSRSYLAGLENADAITKWRTSYYFSSDGIMRAFEPEDFGNAMKDAEWILDDLDLSTEDIEELKQNGYLEFYDEESNVPVLDSQAPPKGKKK